MIGFECYPEPLSAVFFFEGARCLAEKLPILPRRQHRTIDCRSIATAKKILVIYGYWIGWSTNGYYRNQFQEGHPSAKRLHVRAIGNSYRWTPMRRRHRTQSKLAKILPPD